MSAQNSTKHIFTRHLDYWLAIYSIGKYTTKNAGDLEIYIANDKEATKEFFHFDLYNLPYLERELKKDDSLAGQYQSMKNGELEYIIDYLYYDERKRVGNGYDFYLYMSTCGLHGKTIFDIKNKRDIAPDYASLYLAEHGPLFPEKVVWWLEKLSVELFGEHLRFSFEEDIAAHDREKMLREYESPDGFLKIS